MANARTYASPEFIRKMVDLARDMGLDPGGFEVAPGGVLRVLPKVPNPKSEVEEWLDQI